jgi:hypothetical protein
MDQSVRTDIASRYRQVRGGFAALNVVGSRIPLAEIAQRIKDTIVALTLDPGTYTVGTCLDADYSTSFMQQYNKIWVGGQRLLPRDNAQGLSEKPRQNMKCEILIQPVIQRFPPSAVTTADPESRLAVLENVVNQAMFGWRHNLARYAFGYGSLIDGPAYEPICTLNMIFATQLVYQSN